MSLGGSKSSQKGTDKTVVQQELDPVTRDAIERVIGQTETFNPTNNPALPAVRNTSGATQQGIDLLQNRPEAGFVRAGEDMLTGILSGQGSPQMDAVRDRITSDATKAVSDRFTSANRAGSPGEAEALAGEVARQLAPFEFGQLQNAFSQAAQFTPLLDNQAQRLLTAGEIIQAEDQLQIDEPFLQFERFANPLLAAAGRLPATTTQTGTFDRSGSTKSASLSLF
jgi:hypothetical protein